MNELSEYEFEVHFINQPYREITRQAKTQQEALAIAEADYQDEIGFSSITSVDPSKI